MFAIRFLPHIGLSHMFGACKYFTPSVLFMLSSTHAPEGYHRQLFALQDYPAKFSIPSTITVHRGDPVLVGGEEIIDSQRMCIAQNVHGLKGHIPVDVLGTSAELVEGYFLFTVFLFFLSCFAVCPLHCLTTIIAAVQ